MRKLWLRQRGGDASTNVQAGRDLMLHTGVTIEEVREIALGVFHQNFLELRGIAEDVARGRAERITNDFLDALQERAPNALDSASDPDMQRAIFDAQKEYACSGDEDLEAVLVDLLVDRANEHVRETRTIVLNEAITAAPKLTPQQRRAIAVCFFVRHTRWTGPLSVDGYYEGYLLHNLVPLAQDLPAKHTAYQHIEYVGAGTVGIGSVQLVEALQRSAQGYFTHGVASEELPESLRSLPDETGLLIPSLRDPDKFQLPFRTEEELNEVLSKLDEEDIRGDLAGDIRQVFNTGLLTSVEIRDEIVARVPGFEALLSAWDDTPLNHLNLTSVGIAIGHGYWRRLTGSDAPLAIWISD
jgi:hypothetical protein